MGGVQALPGYRVLVVDDDPLLRTIAGSLLKAMGCVPSVVEGDEGATAEIDRAAAACEPFDVLLVDLQLAGASGLDTCRRLRAAGIAAPMVIMSGDDLESLLGREPAVDGILRKPFTVTQLRDCIERFGGGGGGPR